MVGATKVVQYVVSETLPGVSASKVVQYVIPAPPPGPGPGIGVSATKVVQYAVPSQLPGVSATKVVQYVVPGPSIFRSDGVGTGQITINVPVVVLLLESAGVGTGLLYFFSLEGDGGSSSVVRFTGGTNMLGLKSDGKGTGVIALNAGQPPGGVITPPPIRARRRNYAV